MAMMILQALAKAFLSPIMFFIKYNREMGVLDNLACYVFFIAEPFMFGSLGMTEKEKMAKLQATQRFISNAAAKNRDSIKKMAGITLEEYNIDSLDGTPVKLYVTRPVSVAPGVRLPVILYLHGGGMVIGSPLDDQFKQLVDLFGSECMLAGLQYRLGTEGGKFPLAFHDCAAAMKHFASQDHKIILTGPSAGGYYALKSAMLAREAGIPIQAMIPIAPLTHCNFDGSRDKTPSCQKFGGRGWFSRSNSLSAEAMDIMASGWVSPEDRQADGHDIRDAKVSGLPPCTIISFTADILFDEGKEFHEKIVQAGGDSCFIPVQASHSFGCQALGFKAAEAAIRKALS